MKKATDTIKLGRDEFCFIVKPNGTSVTFGFERGPNYGTLSLSLVTSLTLQEVIQSDLFQTMVQNKYDAMARGAGLGDGDE